MRLIYDLSIEAVNPNNHEDDHENRFYAMQIFNEEELEKAIMAFSVMEGFLVSIPHVLTVELASFELTDEDIYDYNTKKVIKTTHRYTDEKGDTVVADLITREPEWTPDF